MKATLGQLNSTTRKATSLAQEKGASAWLGMLLIEEHGFVLRKGAFRDALALTYGWQPNDLPPVCFCGKANSVQHTLSCTKGGFPIFRHNDILDLTASLMEEVNTSTGAQGCHTSLSNHQNSSTWQQLTYVLLYSHYYQHDSI